jgi:hypothetical protein
MPKQKRIGFTIKKSDYEIWKHVTDDLIQRRLFRSRTEIFENLVYFLQRGRLEDIKSFKETSMI